MPPEEWRDQVQEEVGVECAGEGAPGYTVQSGGVPGYLWPVDGQVWRDRPAQALPGEQFGVWGGERAAGAAGLDEPEKGGQWEFSRLEIECR